MYLSKVLKSLILFLIILSAFSCQKLPVPVSDSTGILIIPLEVINETDKSSFGYNYILRVKRFPDSEETIKLYPNESRKFFISQCLPAGEYIITGMTSVGVRERSIRADKLKVNYDFLGSFFDINPNQITILDQKMVVSKLKKVGKRWSERWNFESIDDEYRLKIVSELKQLKNFKLWSMKKDKKPL